MEHSTTRADEASTALPPGYRLVAVSGLDELIDALDRADRKGYMPDAMREEWEAFCFREVAGSNPDID